MFILIRACNLFKMFSILAVAITLFSPRNSASGIPTLPTQTPHASDAFEISGWTPKPTSGPKLDLLRRQDSDFSPLCGFVTGNVSQILSCTAQTEYCNFDIPSSAFGCCTGSALTGCGYFTSCLDSTAPCDAACQRNTAVQRCSESLYPRCVKYTYDIVGAVFSNFGCMDVVDEPTQVFAVLATTVDGEAGATSSAEEARSYVVVSSSSELEVVETSASSSEVSSSSDPGMLSSSSSSGPSRVAFTQTQATASDQIESTSPAAASSSPTNAESGSAPRSLGYAGAAGACLYVGIFALSLST